MPAPLPVDWDALKTLYIKGASFAEIAKRSGISAVAVRAHASRYKWKEAVAAASTALQQSVTLTWAERGQHWANRVGDVVEKHLAHIERAEPGSMKARDFESLLRVLETLDKIGRRTFGLDSHSASSALALQVNVNAPGRDFGPAIYVTKECTPNESDGDQSAEVSTRGLSRGSP